MQKSTGNPLVEPTPEKGRTGNMLIDSDVEIKSILALPTPPSTKRKVAANFASTELAGAQSAYSPAQTPIATSAHVPLCFSSTAAGVSVINGAQRRGLEMEKFTSVAEEVKTNIEKSNVGSFASVSGNVLSRASPEVASDVFTPSAVLHGQPSSIEMDSFNGLSC